MGYLSSKHIQKFIVGKTIFNILKNKETIWLFFSDGTKLKMYNGFNSDFIVTPYDINGEVIQSTTIMDENPETQKDNTQNNLQDAKIRLLFDRVAGRIVSVERDVADMQRVIQRFLKDETPSETPIETPSETPSEKPMSEYERLKKQKNDILINKSIKLAEKIVDNLDATWNRQRLVNHIATHLVDNL